MMETVIKSGTFTQQEIAACIRYTKKRWGVRLPRDLKLILERNENGTVEVTYDPPIARSVYRSTDYLVNDLDKLNSAKRAEHEDKQMHSAKG